MWMLFLPAFQTWFPTSKIRSELRSFVLGRETGETCNDFLVPPGIYLHRDSSERTQIVGATETRMEF